MTCCGNQGASYVPGVGTGGATGETVRMEYIGAAIGPQSIIGPGSGRVYRAGRMPGVRFHDVDGRDVDGLRAMGAFRSLRQEGLVEGGAIVE